MKNEQTGKENSQLPATSEGVVKLLLIGFLFIEFYMKGSAVAMKRKNIYINQSIIQKLGFGLSPLIKWARASCTSCQRIPRDKLAARRA